jgi:predicted small metal-binding protein
MKHVTCSCGYVASAETADELLTAVEAHIVAAHASDATSTSERVQTATDAAGAGPETKVGRRRP